MESERCFFLRLIWIFIFHHQELAKAAAEALEFLLFGRVGSSSWGEGRKEFFVQGYDVRMIYSGSTVGVMFL